MQLLCRAFLTHFTKTPEAIALVTREGKYSYQQLGQWVCGIAKRLQDYPEGCAIGVWGEASFFSYAALLAIASQGQCYVPLNPQFPPQRNEQILKVSQCKALIVKDKTQLPPTLKTLPLITLEDVKPKTTLHFRPYPEDGLAYMLFTSGSTGTPKGVMITPQNVEHFIRNESSAFPFQKNDRFLQMFALTFDLSLWAVIMAWMNGAICYAPPHEEQFFYTVLDWLEHHSITAALLVPSILDYWLPYLNEIHLPHLRYNAFCGEPLYHSKLLQWQKAIPNAVIENLYGPTEATIYCSRYRWTPEQCEKEHYLDIVPIGKAIQGTTLWLEKNENEAIGEITISSASVAAGYKNYPTLTQKHFFENLHYGRSYRTGDLGKWNDQGNLLFIGRKDNLIKIQGYRVELAEIEYYLRSCFPKGRWVVIYEKPKLYAVTDLAPSPSIQEVRQQLKRYLPTYMLPYEIFYIEHFPVNANGKLDRKTLAAYVLSKVR